jgi:uncharacterized membrane protein (UPF0182 family)
MSSFSDDPEIVLPRRRGPGAQRRPVWPITLGVLFLLFLVVQNAVPMYTDWLWFGEVGYRNVFFTTIATKLLMFFVFGLLFFLIFYTNVRHARNLAPESSERFLAQTLGPGWGAFVKRGIGWVLAAIALFLSLMAGRYAVDFWPSWLEFTHGVSFGVHDPVFGLDASFYVFRAPFLRFVSDYLFYVLLATAVASIGIHVADRAIETVAGLPNAAPRVKNQVLLLAGCLALIRAFACRLDAYDLLLANNSVFSGAGYTDLHIRLLGLNLQMVLLTLTAVACVAGILRRGDFKWPIITAGAWIASVVVMGLVLPAVVEKAYVEPNQFLAEQQYIARNIRYTRLGFGLQGVRQVNDFPADLSLTSAGLKGNQATLDNVRLWDYDYLSQVYGQLQTIKTYYKFKRATADGSNTDNIDIDRYPIGGTARQVMLAARELDATGVSQTWQNQRMAYTHGYGVVMSPVNRVVQGGPYYFLQGIPVVNSPEASNIRISQPDIYFGQLDQDYVFVETEQQEFDYPSTQGGGQGGSGQDHYTRYRGRGGIRIGDAPLAKLAFSLRLADPNVLLARGFRPDTRVLFRRDIRERVQAVAPFVQLDGDPYLVVDPDTGRLFWILDCYTLTDRFPYSSAVSLPVAASVTEQPNYIRNSVKATVDAYDGSVKLYIADPADPIVRTYASVFPGLLKPFSAMPAGLKAHLRYPEDLFRMQRAVYAVYHVDDPRVFYLKEDQWAIPTEPNPGSGPSPAAAAPADVSGGSDSGLMAPVAAQEPQMVPYYVIMRLPEGTDGPGTTEHEEFLLMSPLAPFKREKQNILGWMCARCDGDRYGQLVLYRFAQSTSVEGPSQVIALANADTTISKELSLLRQGGSNANFGNLLVIPIGHSLLYIAPLYVSATNSTLPQLQRVLVTFGPRVVMEDTLEKALAAIFEGYTPGSPAQPAPSATTAAPSAPGRTYTVPAAVRDLIMRAGSQYDAAQSRLKAGDFAGYGARIKEMEATLKQLQSEAGRP